MLFTSCDTKDILDLNKLNMYEKTVELKNGQAITMKLDEEFEKITFWDGDNELNGEFEFIASEYKHDVFLLSRMYTPIMRNGLGESALRFFKEETGDATIWTREPGGPQYSDGSYLTEHAPSFVMKMQKLGLIEEWFDPMENENYQKD